jgi:uncharacterized protein YqgC (DUF456 family)
MTDSDKTAPHASPPPLANAAIGGSYVAQSLPATRTSGQNYKGMAIGSLVCAIVGIFIIQPILGTIAIVLGAVARGKMRTANNLDGRGLATAGLVIGIIDVVISIIVIVIVLSSIKDIFSQGQ